jgi:alpha-L-fucosidase
MIHLAGPVFTLAERRFNEELAGELERLRPSLQVFLPQRYDKPNDQMKSLNECLQTLVRCASGDANVLFNVGPMPNG